MVVVNDALKTLVNLRQRKDLEVAKHTAVLGVREHLKDDVDAARRFRATLDHLEKAIAAMSRMLRLFRC